MTSLRVASHPSVDPSSPELDKDLTLAFQRGERDAYNEIYRRHYPRIIAICRRMLTSTHDADEAAQETFLRVYQSLGRFNGRYQMGPWIARIATNVCLDRLRSSSRHPTTPVPLDAWEAPSLEEPVEGGPEEHCLRKFEGRTVLDTLGRLAPSYRAAIYLRDYQGLSYEDIGTELDITESQVKALLHRARAAFRRSWKASAPAVLFPLRLVERLRRMASSGREQISQVAGSSGSIAAGSSPMAASCSGILQQCGVISDRVAAVLVAGSLAVTGSAMVADPPVDEQAPTRPVVREAASLDPSASREPNRQKPARAPEKQASEPVVVAPPPVSEGDEAPAEQEPPPSGDAEAPPEGTASPEDQGSPTPPAPVKEPAGFTSEFVWELPPSGACSDCLREAAVLSESVVTDGSELQRFSLDHQGSITSGGAASFGFSMSTFVDTGGHFAELYLYRSGGTYRYRLEGSLYNSEATEWGGRTYTFAGTYRLSAGASTGSDVARSGTYEARFAISGAGDRAVSSALVLRESTP